VSWWRSIKDAYRPWALIIAKLLKERCISLVVRGRPFVSMTEIGVGCLNLRNIFLRDKFVENTKLRSQI
jgi:hypothetical protein